MVINRSKTVFQNFIDLIRESNPSFPVVTPDKITIGTPVADSSVVGRNTRIEIAAVKNQGWSGSRTLYYNRSLFTTGLASPISAITPGNGELAAALGERISATLNLHASQIVVNGGNGWSLSGNQSIVPVTNSLLYVPSAGHVVNASAATGRVFEVTLGSYTSVAFKDSVARIRYAASTNRTFPNLLDTGHSVTGTVGSFQLNPSGLLRGFVFSPVWNYANSLPYIKMSLTISPEINIPIGGTCNVRLTNIITGQTLTLLFTSRAPLNDDATEMTMDTEANLAPIGGNAVGARIRIEFL